MTHWAFVLGAIVGLALVSGCVSESPHSEFQKPGLTLEKTEHPLNTKAPYRLDTGDRLRITVYDQPELSNTYGINQTGQIAFPLVGSVSVRGLAASQVETLLATKLRNGYLRNPDVTVEMDQYRPIFIMGEVLMPGQYAYLPGMTVQMAVATAGGYTPRASQDKALITRQINGKTLAGNVMPLDPILAGDLLTVGERTF